MHILYDISGDYNKILYSSIVNTLISLNHILELGNLNDGFTLLRQYVDAIATNLHEF